MDPAPPDTPPQRSYDGLCNLCGATGRFEQSGPAWSIQQRFPCPRCGAALRFRNEAAALIDEIGRGRHLSLQTATEDSHVRSLSVYNIGCVGPVRDWLRRLPEYTESAYWPDAVPGEIRDGTVHQDLHELTFADESFDVVVSSHVMEHVAEPRRALAEILRILRPGGTYVFSVPMKGAIRERSVVRATRRDGEIVHIEEPSYHQSPGGEPSLVFTDFGSDLLDLMDALGFVARQRRPNMGVDAACAASVFVGTKPHR